MASLVLTTYVGDEGRQVYIGGKNEDIWLMWLFLIFVAVPVIEIALFIQVGGWIGLWPTLAIVIATAALGTWLVRQQGALALGELRGSLQRMDDPTAPLAHGAMILLAGALLLTPGFFTDACGFALLMRPVRVWLMHQIGARVQVARFEMGGQQTYPNRSGDPIEAEYHEVQQPEGELPSEASGETRPGQSGWTRH